VSSECNHRVYQKQKPFKKSRPGVLGEGLKAQKGIGKKGEGREKHGGIARDTRGKKEKTLQTGETSIHGWPKAWERRKARSKAKEGGQAKSIEKMGAE